MFEVSIPLASRVMTSHILTDRVTLLICFRNACYSETKDWLQGNGYRSRKSLSTDVMRFPPPKPAQTSQSKNKLFSRIDEIQFRLDLLRCGYEGDIKICGGHGRLQAALHQAIFVPYSRPQKLKQLLIPLST